MECFLNPCVANKGAEEDQDPTPVDLGRDLRKQAQNSPGLLSVPRTDKKGRKRRTIFQVTKASVVR